jgi:ABC-type phosphate/phosphonate transport system substrate-binding protein
MRSTWRKLAVGLLAALIVAPLAFGDEPKEGKIRIGLTDTLFRGNPEARDEKTTRSFQSLLKEQTGLEGQVFTGLKPDELREHLKDGKLQLAIFQGYEYAWERPKDSDLKPLLIAIDHKQHVHALLIVRKDSAAASFADLKGKTLAVPRRGHEFAQLFLDRRCAAVEKAPKDYFSKILTLTSSEEVVDAVVNGQIDVGLTDSVFLDWYEKNKAERFARLKVVEKSPVFPAIVVVYRAGGLDDATRDRLRKGMLSAKDNPRGVQLMTLCQMTSFEPIPDDYDKLLTEIAKAYPAPKEGKGKK